MNRFSLPSTDLSGTGERPPLILRSLVVEDVPAVHCIEVAATPDPWSESLFADELSEGGAERYWLVAEAMDGSLVGFGGLLFVADDAHIMNLAVDPDLQRQGIAAHLLSALLLEAGDRGITAATLEVRASNAAALGLYRTFGFIESGRRPRYYADGEDAVIMWARKLYKPDYRQLLSELGELHDR